MPPLEPTGAAGTDILALPAPVLLALSLAIGAMLIAAPLTMFLHARANKPSHPDRRVLFGSAMISSGATALWMALIVLAPGLPRLIPMHGAILPFVTLFLWAWCLLDFARGLRAAGLTPRFWSLGALTLCAALLLGFLLPLFALT